MVYCGSEASITIDLGKLAGTEVEAVWVDPRSAESVSIGGIPKRGAASFSTPDGWEDALLVLESVGGGGS